LDTVFPAPGADGGGEPKHAWGQPEPPPWRGKRWENGGKITQAMEVSGKISHGDLMF